MTRRIRHTCESCQYRIVVVIGEQGKSCKYYGRKDCKLYRVLHMGPSKEIVMEFCRSCGKQLSVMRGINSLECEECEQFTDQYFDEYMLFRDGEEDEEV